MKRMKEPAWGLDRVKTMRLLAAAAGSRKSLGEQLEERLPKWRVPRMLLLPDPTLRDRRLGIPTARECDARCRDDELCRRDTDAHCHS